MILDVAGGQRSSVNQSMDNLNSCVSYCMDDLQCRRVLLLKYFGEDFPATQCSNTCDTCAQAGRTELTDYSQDAILIVKLLRCILAEPSSQSSGRYGKGSGPTVPPTLCQLTKVYSGSKDKDCAKHLHLRAKALPSGHKVPKLSVIERILQTMVLKEFLVEDRRDNFNGFSSFHLSPGMVSLFLFGSMFVYFLVKCTVFICGVDACRY